MRSSSVHAATVPESCSSQRSEYGEREATVEDLTGHRWQFTETIREDAPEEWGGHSVGA